MDKVTHLSIDHNSNTLLKSFFSAGLGLALVTTSIFSFEGCNKNKIKETPTESIDFDLLNQDSLEEFIISSDELSKIRYVVYIDKDKKYKNILIRASEHDISGGFNYSIEFIDLLTNYEISYMGDQINAAFTNVFDTKDDLVTFIKSNWDYPQVQDALIKRYVELNYGVVVSFENNARDLVSSKLGLKPAYFGSELYDFLNNEIVLLNGNDGKSKSKVYNNNMN